MVVSLVAPTAKTSFVTGSNAKSLNPVKPSPLKRFVNRVSPSVLYFAITPANSSLSGNKVSH